jgi:hypothetical protein
MRKYRSYIFLGSLTIIFLIVGYKIFDPENKEVKVNQIVQTADSLVNSVETPEFNKAFNYMDSCLIKDKELYDDKKFQEKYDRLKTIINIK